LFILRGHTGPARSLTFAPDSRTLATGSDDTTIRLWDVETGLLKGVLVGHADWVRALAFSPDGNTLASGGADQKIHFWHRSAGQPVASLR
jgi:WD40 repeat protein